MRSPHGFTLTELLVAIALGGLLLLIAVPALSGVMHRSYLDAATRHLVGEVNRARSRAVTTGWEYRVVGFDSSATANRNRFRTLARRTTTTAWPADDAAQTLTAAQYAGPWIDIPSQHRGVSLDCDGTRFEVTFDSRGTAANVDASFNPVRLVGHEGDDKVVEVSVVGNVTVQ
jgi:prepilin-type N-terminal cleavage/methylation domain-containing protein